MTSRACVTPDVLIKTNLVSHRRQLPSTHADTLSASARRASSAPGPESGGRRRGGHRRHRPDSNASAYRSETFGLPRRIPRHQPIDETDWDRLELAGVDGSPLVARISRTMTSATCRVSLALMKTHVTSMVTFSLKNMLSCIHLDDRIMMHGHSGGGNGYRGWKKLVVEFLKGDSAVVNALTRSMGRVRRLQSALKGKNGPEAWRNLTAAELGYLRSVEAMNRNLVALSNAAKPHISIIDGFVAMHREGPRHGTPIRLGTVVASVDAVAADAVAAAVMGFDPMKIGYLKHAHDAGLGRAELDGINIVGDSLASVARRCVPHSNHAIQRHWDRLAELVPRDVRESALPAPHGRRARITEEVR